MRLDAAMAVPGAGRCDLDRMHVLAEGDQAQPRLPRGGRLGDAVGVGRGLRRRHIHQVDVLAVDDDRIGLDHDDAGERRLARRKLGVERRRPAAGGQEHRGHERGPDGAPPQIAILGSHDGQFPAPAGAKSDEHRRPWGPQDETGFASGRSLGLDRRALRQERRVGRLAAERRGQRPLNEAGPVWLAREGPRDGGGGDEIVHANAAKRVRIHDRHPRSYLSLDR